MHVRTGLGFLCMPIVVLVVGLSPVVAGQSQTDELEAMRRRIDDLTAVIEQMQQKHEQEIKELKEQLDHLGEKQPFEEPAEEVDELAGLRQLALDKAGGKEEPEKTPEETVFKAAGLSLQKLNPEISAAGDFLTYYHHQDGTRQRTDAEIRGLELNIQSYLDPFSYMKATAHMSDEGVDIEEVYFTRFSAIAGANLDIGRFRQPFGTVNRWHEDALDQVLYPLALRRIFGDEGLNQTGASLDWTLPTWGQAHQEFIFQVTNGENEALFEGDALGTPSMLVHYKNYRDLSENAYLEWGLSGLFGWNDQWDIQTGPDPTIDREALGTRVFGLDVAYLWEPLDRALYRNVEWRSEFYVLNRDLLALDGSGRDTINAWGAYSYLQSKVARNWVLGVRLDYFKPDSKDYAETADLSLAPIAYTSEDPHRWQIGPYVTWWQSEWVRFRTEYDYAWGDGMEPDEHILWGQATFAIGPHKHERY